MRRSLRRTARRGATALAGLLLALTWVWCSAAPASAGGPTSVIMVNPTTGQATALHARNPRYQQLAEAVGADLPQHGSASRPASVSDCFECEIRLTWLIHDMSIWRIDRVHLTSNDGVWIETVVADESGTPIAFDQDGVWQRPHDATALLALLQAANLTATSVSEDDPDRQPVSVTPQASATSAATAADGGGSAGPPVGLVAIGSGIVGIGAGLGISWLIRRTRSSEDRVVLTG